MIQITFDMKNAKDTSKKVGYQIYMQDEFYYTKQQG